MSVHSLAIHLPHSIPLLWPSTGQLTLSAVSGSIYMSPQTEFVRDLRIQRPRDIFPVRFWLGGSRGSALQGALQLPCLSPPCPPALSWFLLSLCYPGVLAHTAMITSGLLSCKPVSTSLPISLWQLTSVNLLLHWRWVIQHLAWSLVNPVFSFIAYTCPPSTSGVRL